LDIDRDSVKKMFPNLAKEIGSSENKLSMNSIRTDEEAAEKRAFQKNYTNYEPDAVDFLRRCDNTQQAEEIIAYLEKRGELDKQTARLLRKQLTEKGVRSFGQKKEHDHYLKHGER